MISEELKMMINGAIVNGTISDEKRVILKKRALSEGISSDEFDLYLDGILHSQAPETNQLLDGDVKEEDEEDEEDDDEEDEEETVVYTSHGSFDIKKVVSIIASVAAIAFGIFRFNSREARNHDNDSQLEQTETVDEDSSLISWEFVDYKIENKDNGYYQCSLNNPEFSYMLNTSNVFDSRYVLVDGKNVMYSATTTSKSLTRYVWDEVLFSLFVSRVKKDPELTDEQVSQLMYYYLTDNDIDPTLQAKAETYLEWANSETEKYDVTEVENDGQAYLFYFDLPNRKVSSPEFLIKLYFNDTIVR